MSGQAQRQIKHIVGANIRFARVENGMTQRELAQAVSGSDSMTASRWERGAVMPSTASLVRLGEVLGRDISWFYTDHTKEAA